MGESTGVAGVDAVVVWSVAITAVLGLLGLLIRFVAKISKAVALFMEDWLGEAGRPGVPPRPGVMERVQVTEARAVSVETRVDGHEDRINGVERRVDGLERTVGQMMLDGCGDGEAEGPGGLLGRRRSVS